MMILTLCFISCITLIYSEEINLGSKKHISSFYPRFDGIGAISGGGATSKLLLSYKEPYKSQILDYLFKPQFGASLHMLKVEIGGDSQSTEGTEASHSHYGTDINCNRGYEWQLILEAKKRNPSILLYGLPWAFPGWVGNFSGNPFLSAYQTSTYIIDWLKCGRNVYKFEFQYIGIWNEKRYDITYIKTLRQMLDKENFKGVQIIAADNKWEIADDIIKDPELAKSIYAIGCHYPGTDSSALARQTNKPLWSSEDYSTENTGTGPGCWARILNQNFVNGNMTSTIAWNLIAAYYDDLPYPRCGLMTAIEPWSGNYEVPTTIWVTAHTTQFTQPGWHYDPAGSGKFTLGGSYVTIFHPEMKDWTMVFESLSHDNSVCIRPSLPPYKVTDQNVTIIVPSKLDKSHSFYLWRTDLTGKKSSVVFRLEKILKPDIKNEIHFFLPVDHIVTLTTVSNGLKGVFPDPPERKPFPIEYEDNFQKYPVNAEPELLSPQVGSFEIDMLSPSSTTKVLKQTVTDQPNQWCFEKPINVRPIALIGNFNKSDITLSISVMMPSYKPANSIFVGARINNSGCTTFLAGGVFFWLNFTSSQFAVTADLNAKKLFVSNAISLSLNQWYNVSIILKDSNGWFYVNEKIVVELNNLNDKSPLHGFAGIGTDKFGLAYFYNLRMKTGI